MIVMTVMIVIVVVIIIVVVIVIVVIVTAMGRDRDFDRSIVAAVRVLDVHPGAALVGRVEVEPGELGADRAVGRPAPKALARILQVSVVIQIEGEPDVVVGPAVAILDDVDVVIVIDRQVVGVGQRRTDGRPVARSIVLRSTNTEMTLFFRSST